MDRCVLPVFVSLFVFTGCGSPPRTDPAPPTPSAPKTQAVSWEPLPDVTAVLELPLIELPSYLGVTPRTKTVDKRFADAPQDAAYPSLRRATLEAWKAEGWVKTFELSTKDRPLTRAFFAPLDTSDSAWHVEHRVRLEVDDPRATSLELLMDSCRPVVDFEVTLRGVLIVPRFADDASFAEQLQTLGVDPQRCTLRAVHPILGATYGAEGQPGSLLVTAVGGEHQVTAVLQGPLPDGFAPWDEVRAEVQRRLAAGEAFTPLLPWVRHAAFGELAALLGTAADSRAEHEDLEAELLGLLQSNVSPGRFLAGVLHARDVQRRLALVPGAPPPALPKHLDRLREHAVAQRGRARERGLPVVAATWGWLAWELRDRSSGAARAERDFDLPLRQAVLPVLYGEVRYAPEAVEGTPLALRGRASLSSASVKRDESLVRWRVAYGDFDSIEGAPTEVVPTQVTWEEPNPAYPKWVTACEDLQDQIDFNVQSVPTIEVPTGRILRNGEPETESVPDTNSTEYLRAEELGQQLDVLLLDEPSELITRETTIPVSIQRYTGSVTRRYTVFAEDDRVVDRFDEVTEVSLALRRHAAVPEAGLAALDEHMTLEQVSGAQTRGVIQRDLRAFYRGVLQRALRAELELRLPEGTEASDAADELAWGQWWLGLEVDEDLRPALGPALALQAGKDPLLGAAKSAPGEEGVGLDALLRRASSAPALPR